MFIMQVLVSQVHFLVNKIAELDAPPIILSGKRHNRGTCCTDLFTILWLGAMVIVTLSLRHVYVMANHRRHISNRIVAD